MTTMNDEELARKIGQTLRQARPSRALAQQILAVRQQTLHHAASTRFGRAGVLSQPWFKWAAPALAVLVLMVGWQTLRYEPQANNVLAEQLVDDVLLDTLDS